MDTKTYSTLAPVSFGVVSMWAAPVMGSVPAPATRLGSSHGMTVAPISAAANAAKGANRAVAAQDATGEAFEDPV